ncbi:MAG: hypothetical protein M3O99_02630 [Chloroflexota bacterium]|nr:hypothetical protein [Chloroflexota bacterium]
MRRFLITTCVVLASLGITAGAALADSCDNTSRAAPSGPTGPGPLIKGNWVWLPSLGIPGLPETWGFAPPGTFDSTTFGFPGANGNYTNGQTSSLLGVSANCPHGANANRQTDHGIQSGCF